MHSRVATHLWHSLDAGHHWFGLGVQLPDGEPDTGRVQWGQPVWLGSRMFVPIVGVNSAVLAEQHGQVLAVSDADGPLHWVADQALVPPGVPADQLATLFAFQGWLYVTFSGVSCPATGCPVERSQNGVQWQHLAFPGVDVNSVIPSADGRQLLSHLSHALTYVESADGGHTWRPLPAVLTGSQLSAPLSTPDGSLLLLSTANATLYRLAPGATQWVPVVKLPSDGNGPLVSVSWDAQGHPAQIWLEDGGQDSVATLVQHAV